MEPLKPGRMSAPGKTEPTDLIVRARTGDTQAWGDLYREYAPAIFRFCRRAMPTREDAEDATMEIFMKLRDKLIQYDQSRSFTAWLYKVAANHCWDMLRRRRVRQDKETEDVTEMPLEAPEPNQLEKLIEERTSEEVRRALDKLGLRARMALVMRYYSDMSYDEIADALGVRRAFVGVVLLRARHELRQALGENNAVAVGGIRLSTPGDGTIKHIDEMTLLLYVERQLDRESAQEVSLHTQTCEKCLTLLRALDRESRLLTRAMLEQDEPLPARLAEFRLAVKKSMQWIWGVVFGLAVLGVYAFYSGYIEPMGTANWMPLDSAVAAW